MRGSLHNTTQQLSTNRGTNSTQLNFKSLTSTQLNFDSINVQPGRSGLPRVEPVLWTIRPNQTNKQQEGMAHGAAIHFGYILPVSRISPSNISDCLGQEISPSQSLPGDNTTQHSYERRSTQHYTTLLWEEVYTTQHNTVMRGGLHNTTQHSYDRRYAQHYTTLLL